MASVPTDWGAINPAVQTARANIPKVTITGNPTVDDPYASYGASSVLPSGIRGPGGIGAAVSSAVKQQNRYQTLLIMTAFLVAAVIIHHMITGKWSIFNGMLIGVAGGVGVEIAKTVGALNADNPPGS